MRWIVMSTKGLAVAAAAGFLVAAAPQTVMAATPYECADESVCLFQEHGGVGAKLEVHDAVADLRNTPGWNDKARSVFNRTSDDWCLYRDENYKGEFKIVGPGSGTNLTNEFDRSVSSLRPMPDGGCAA
ncbi:peptidase inhibitor family I36 protein [Streptomyces sp. NPDC045470]|uniref:peptidase inhibitor family I36 protein n=1 Tax=unclassified Streptomyces TaxID=2593676 RepID=UPI0033F70EC6